MLVGLGLGVLAAIAGRPDAAAGLVFSSTYFGEISALGYSRERSTEFIKSELVKWGEAVRISGARLE